MKTPVQPTPARRPEPAPIPWMKKAGDPIDKYIVCRPLGTGGGSIVYEVQDEEVGTHFALKLSRFPLAANGKNRVSIERFHHSVQAFCCCWSSSERAVVAGNG